MKIIYKCKICNKIINNEYHMRNHMLKNHFYTENLFEKNENKKLNVKE